MLGSFSLFLSHHNVATTRLGWAERYGRHKRTAGNVLRDYNCRDGMFHSSIGWTEPNFLKPVMCLHQSQVIACDGRTPAWANRAQDQSRRETSRGGLCVCNIDACRSNAVNVDGQRLHRCPTVSAKMPTTSSSASCCFYLTFNPTQTAGDALRVCICLYKNNWRYVLCIEGVYQLSFIQDLKMSILRNRNTG